MISLRPKSASLAVVVFAAALFLSGGCASQGSSPASGPGTSLVPTNQVGDDRLPDEIRRVVLLPLHGGRAAPSDTVRELDAVFATALQRQQRFEVVVLSREECLRRFRAESFASTEYLPRNMMAVLRDEWGADAVMFVDVTAFEPNRPLVLGIRAKLAQVEDMRMVWALDTIFSAADPAVAAGARRHAANSRRGGGPVNLDAGILLSPSRFGGYAAETAFATLPAR